MQIRIKPLDPVLFRGGRPFNIDLDMWASSMFPPYPSVIYGALRAVYFVNHPNEIEYANKDDDKTLSLRIKMIAFSKEGKVYLPTPNDYVKEKGSQVNRAMGLELRKLDGVISSCPTPYGLKGRLGMKVEGVQGTFVDKESFETILCGLENEVEYVERSSLVCEEPKLGIGIDHDIGTVKEHLIYRMLMQRFIDSEIIVQYEDLELPNEGFLQLGGERRVALFKHNDGNLEPKAPQSDGKLFRLILTTPAIFNNGWLPEWIDSNTLSGKFDDLRVELVTASLGKPIPIGGYDIRGRKFKPMLRAIPSGSVYYFKIVEGSFQRAVELFHGKAISDSDKKQTEGFGISYVGAVE